MKRVLIIAGLVFLAAALVFLNQGLKKSAVPDHDEEEQAQQSKAPPPPPAPIDAKTVPSSEETVGDPKTARHHIEAGWVYDEGNQQKPETLTVALQEIREYVGKSGGIASAEIVNLDVPVEDRSPAARTVTELGIFVDGKPISTGNISSIPFPSDHLIEALQAPPPRK